MRCMKKNKSSPANWFKAPTLGLPFIQLLACSKWFLFSIWRSVNSSTCLVKGLAAALSLLHYKKLRCGCHWKRLINHCNWDSSHTCLVIHVFFFIFEQRIESRLRWFREEQFNKTITTKTWPMLHGPANEFLLLFHLWAGIFNNCDPDVSLLRTRLVKCQGKCKLISNRPMDASDLFDSCLLCFLCWSRKIPDPDVKSSAITHHRLAKFYINSEPVKQTNYIQKTVTNKR